MRHKIQLTQKVRTSFSREDGHPLGGVHGGGPTVAAALELEQPATNASGATEKAAREEAPATSEPRGERSTVDVDARPELPRVPSSEKREQAAETLLKPHEATAVPPQQGQGWQRGDGGGSITETKVAPSVSEQQTSPAGEDATSPPSSREEGARVKESVPQTKVAPSVSGQQTSPAGNDVSSQTSSPTSSREEGASVEESGPPTASGLLATMRVLAAQHRDVAGALYALVCVLGLSFAMLQATAGGRSERLRELCCSLEAEQAELETEMQSKLVGSDQPSAVRAEESLDASRRHFLRFLLRVRDEPERFTGPLNSREEFLQPLRCFVRLWLSVWEQWSFDPLQSPGLLMSTKELEGCADIVGVAGTVARRVVTSPSSAVRPHVAALQDAWADASSRLSEPGSLLRQCGEDGLQLGVRFPYLEVQPQSWLPVEIFGGFFVATILSPLHLLLLFGLVWGTLVIGVELLLGRFGSLSLCIVAEFCLTVMVVRIRDIEELGCVVLDVQRLQEAKTALQRHRKQVESLCQQLDSLGSLWQSRTAPCLDLLGQLQDQVWEIPDRDKLNFLEGVNARLEDTLGGLGSFDCWLGKPTDLHSFVTEQLRDCADFIATFMDDEAVVPLIFNRLDRPFGFLMVRVHAAHSLDEGLSRLGALPETYVTVATNLLSPKQTNIKKSFNPVWSEEFALPLRWDEPTLDVRVCGVGSCSSSGGGDFCLGYLKVKCQSLTPGFWHKRSEALLCGKKQHGTKAPTLDYEIRFTHEPRDLLKNVSAGSAK